MIRSRSGVPATAGPVSSESCIVTMTPVDSKTMKMLIFPELYRVRSADEFYYARLGVPIVLSRCPCGMVIVVVAATTASSLYCAVPRAKCQW